MEFEIYDRTRKQLAFLLLWLSANIIGCALGWVAAESVGQLINRFVTWQAGVVIAALLFELILWTCRGTVLHFVGDYSSWKPIDSFILLVAEAFGWLLGEGNHEVNGSVWISAGPVWAVLLASSLWMVIWLMRQPRRGARWWPVWAALWALTGLLGSSLLLGVGFALSLEAREWASETIHVTAGWALAGAIIGLFAGSITGLAFLRLLRWSTLTRM